MGNGTRSSIPPPPRPSKWIDGRYELEEVAGRGGMAVVWRATHHGPGRFARRVAVKQMHPHLAEDEVYREMFHEEARIGSLLQDANIAQVFDFVIENGQHYLVMEWVNGIDLATYSRYVATLNRPTRWELIAAVGIGMLRGLAVAHSRTHDGVSEPIVHRDISPHNVLINDQGRAKIIDFGLCFARDREISDTNPGMAKGKLAYLAPEIVRGGRPTPQTDQFAAGIVLWESLAGKRAFDADTPYETYKRVANAELERINELRPDVPKPLARLIHRALAVDPAKRYPDANAMANALGGVLSGHRADEDLYVGLARTVMAARVALNIGERSQDPETESSIEELQSGLVELLVDDENKPSGFRKWIPAIFDRFRE